MMTVQRLSRSINFGRSEARLTDAPLTAKDKTPGQDTPVVTDEALLARFQNARNRPPGTETLGFAMLRVDQAKMEIEASFQGRAEFTNPAGQVQGGFLCAMLDETMSIAGVVASGMSAFLPTLEMKTSFLRPAAPGTLYCVGRVVKWGKVIAFLQGELYDGERRLLATATSTAMPQPFKSATRPER
jgi:uncharacterized protein (TIGR00369 family)